MEAGMGGSDDELLLNLAFEVGRIVLTHDSDFGTLAFSEQKPFKGIVYLKPGHIHSEFTVASLKALFENVKEVFYPFIIVLLHSQTGIKIRYRQR